MKKVLLLCFLTLLGFNVYSQTEMSTNFVVNDCMGNQHDFFSELEEGKVIVVAWVMPCFSCLGPAIESYTVVQNYKNSHPGQVVFYLSDDYGDTSCSTLSSWIRANGMRNCDAVFSDATLSMSDFGTDGMPKVAVIAGSNHKIYYNANSSTAGIEDAISLAISDLATQSVEDDVKGSSINVFPNPAQSEFFVKIELQEQSDIKIEVVSILGQIVKEETFFNSNTGENTLKISTSGIPQGEYFLNITSGNQSLVKSIFIQK